MIRHSFDHNDVLYGPRPKGTRRQFECVRLSIVDHAKATIQPTFRVREA
jgi:hypothetical protein